MEGSDSLIYIRFRLSVYRLGLDLEPDDFFGERNAILADCQKLALMARFYAHPEVSVISTDPFATSRCYFDRPSAPKVESVTDPTATARCHFDRPSAPEVESVDAEIRAQVLADAIAFKKFVVDYLHPELPVTVTDPSATARCYFDRPSAPEVQSVEDTEIRAQVLADAIAFKKFAS